MATKTLSAKKPEQKAKAAAEPKRLSKFGEWMKKHPKGYIEIVDLKAVMR